MNKVYIIAYDLKTIGHDYSSFFDAIKASPKWWHFLESAWLIYTTESAADVWSRLATHFNKNDRLLVIEVRDNCQGWLPKEAWEWIHAHAPK